MRILVVDDDRSVALIASALLQKRGHDVALAHAADEAIEASQAQPPDVILLDVHLPGAGSPAALVARLRTLLPRASILLFSALADDELTSLSQRVGADGAIPKQAAFEIGARLEALAVAGKATP